MKYTIDIRVLDDKDTHSYPTLYPIYYDEKNNECILGLTVLPDTPIEEALEKINVNKMLINELTDNDIPGSNLFKENSKIIERIILESHDLVKDSTSISFVAEQSIKDYIERNPILKTKTMHLNGNYSIDSEVGNELYNLFGEYKNVYLYFDGNKTERHIEEYKKTIDAIDEIVKTIRKHNLSPLEEIMYAYDLVREKVYTRELDTESDRISRDLSSVLFGDKIVCAGYVAIFNSVLKNLGISVMDYKLIKKENNKKGHVRSLVYVKDKKYHVNGVFMFDPTWDSKKCEGDKSYLRSYKFFCKSKDEFRFFDQEYNDVTLSSYSKNLSPRVKKIILTEGLESVPEEMAQSFNDLAILIDGKALASKIIFTNKAPKDFRHILTTTIDTENLMNSLDRYQSLFYGQTLDPMTLLEVMYNVRKREFYSEPDKYPFDTESIKKAVIGSSPLDSKLLHVLFGMPEKLTTEEFDEWKDKNDIDKNIEGIKLTRTLKTILENK